MKILVNNENIVLDDNLTIKELMKHIKIRNQYSAVEVNEQIVPKSLHASFTLKEGDKVEIITAIGGG
jgi:sulfur carrier protein